MKQQDDPKTAFPASVGTPGQRASRRAYAELESKRAEYGWWDGYLSLRREGWDWRKAAYIAWEACPPEARWPKTQVDLATRVLGLKDTSTIRHWKGKQPEIEKRIETLAVEMLGKMAMSQEEVLFRLTQQARASMGDFIKVGEGGNWAFDFEAIKQRGMLIKSLKETQHGVSLTLVDSLGALDRMGRYYKLFTDRLDIDDWRSKLVEGLRDGDVDPSDVREELGDELSEQLFTAAGLPRDAGREAAGAGEAA